MRIANRSVDSPGNAPVSPGGGEGDALSRPRRLMNRPLLWGIRWRLALTYVITILVAMAVIGVVLTGWLRQYYLDNMESILMGHGKELSALFEEYLGGQVNLEALGPSLANQFHQQVNARVQILSAQGRVIGDSGGPQEIGHQVHAAAVAAALNNLTGQTVHGGVIDVAVPIAEGRVIGVVRLLASTQPVSATVETVWEMLGIGTAIALLVATLVGFALARTVTRPLSEIHRTAMAIREGDLAARARKRFDDEVGELAAAINEMATSLGELERMRAEFIGGISHELKTPLTAIKGFSVALLDTLPTGEREVRPCVEIIEQEADRLSRLVEDLLDLARAQAGHFTVHPVPLDLREVVGPVIEQMAFRAQRAGVRLEVQGEGAIRVSGDRDRLKQVLLNLLTNSLNFSPAGTVITVGYGWDAERPFMRVEDQGAGIAEEDLPHVFERFYRARGSQGPGSGLGLSIAREIVQAHGGRIQITSRKGEGTRVTVYLQGTS